MKGIIESRWFVVLIESIYLVALFALALIYLMFPAWQFHVTLAALPLPIGVPWFGAVGAVIISLSGAFEHRKDWDPSWNLWHFARPLIGITLAIVSWLIFQAGILAVGSKPDTESGIKTNLLYYVIAFVVGYREDIFRELIKRVADVILSPGPGVAQPASPGPVISAFDPPSGNAAGSDKITITGSGLSDPTSVKFGTSTGSDVQVVSDTRITVLTPPGDAGSVDVTVTTKNGTATGKFTYT